MPLPETSGSLPRVIRSALCIVAIAAVFVLPVIAADGEPVAHGSEKGETHAAAHEQEPSAFHHAMDNTEEWEIFPNFGLTIPLPHLFGFAVSKFMILELIAAGLIACIYIRMAQRRAAGTPPRGAWDNAFESILVYIRDEVVKPTIGEHDADKFVPFFWTLFLFVLFCNLLGLVPFGGSPTANIYMTGTLAICCFLLLHGAPIAKHGPWHHLKSYWLHIDMPNFYGIGWLFKTAIAVMILVIEIVGTIIKSGVLAVRLFANMMAGHVVLATILLFIVTTRNLSIPAWSGITVASVLGVFALSFLELLVAFLQAYIFVFLASLFVGMAYHPEH